MDHVRRREMAKLDAKSRRILGYWDFGHANISA